jgi:hypothetical protein
MPSTRARFNSSRVITHTVINQFQGGISGMRDKVQLPQGFSPMARNVEWQTTGGFYVRKGIGPLTRGQFGSLMATLPGTAVRFHHYVRDSATTGQITSQYLVATDNGSVYVGVDFGTELTTPGSWLLVSVAGTPIGTVGPPTFSDWDANVYISLGNAALSSTGTFMVRWNGAIGVGLGKAWANDYAAPTGGNMPPARYLATWTERMWAAALVPLDSVDPVLGSRLHWSHPGRPEDWAENDYIDVGQQGDIITGIAPMRDMLVIFKRSSMYALLGSGSTNFRIVELSGTIGSTGVWTRDNQGSVVFWDATMGVCRFDGKQITNLFEPLRPFMEDSITRCGGLVTDGDKIYAATDFQDFYGDRVPAPGGLVQRRLEPRTGFDPNATWQDLIDAGVTWGALATQRWLRTTTTFFNVVWVYREEAGWTSFTLEHPDAYDITMLGQIHARVNPVGDIESHRKIVYGLNSDVSPLYLADQYDDGKDRFGADETYHMPIDSFYMTAWVHGGVPGQIKKWKAPRVVQEADSDGVLMIDVFYDYNYDNLRRTLLSAVPEPGLGFDSFWVDKPGTIGRAKAVMLIIRPEAPRHWGVSSITIPIHPKVLR